MTDIAVKGSVASCGHTLSAAANVDIGGKSVGVAGDTAGGAVSASQSTVTIGGKAVLLKGDSIASHGDPPHASAKITSTPNSTVTIG
jgi:hypothetical protein